jgi:HEAT repeat protein
MRRLSVFFILLAAPLAAARQDADPPHDGKKASEWVKTLQTDASARQRALAVGALAKLWADHRFKESLPMIGRSLRLDSSVAVRANAAAALGALKPEDAKFVAADLVDALKVEREPRVRKEIATTLGRLPDAARVAVAPLTAALKDADPGTRAAAADALARAGGDAKAAAPDLLALLADKEPAVRRAAVFAAARIEPDDSRAAAAALTPLLKTETDADLKRELVVSLGLLGERSREVVEAIAACLDDPDDETCRTAARTLNTFRAAAGPAADKLLALATSKRGKDLRLDGVRGFCSAHGPALKEHVGKLLPVMAADPDFEVRLAVVEELAALGGEVKDDKAVMDALRLRQSDPQVKVREAAAAAVRRITKKPAPAKKP